MISSAAAKKKKFYKIQDLLFRTVLLETYSAIIVTEGKFP